MTNDRDGLRVLISCGGTGGHIYPAIAIADEIRRQVPDANILFVGSKKKMEMQVVPESGYTIKGLDIRGLQRGSILKNLLLPFRILSSIWQSYRIIKDFSPDFAFGTGGYASAPAIFVASMMKIPTFIHEQNAVAGMANKILAKYVKKIFLGFPEAEKFFPTNKIIISGTPLRKKINHLSKDEARRYFEIDGDAKCLLVLGGSLGTKTINNAILNSLNLLIENNIYIIWITGRAYFDQIVAKIPQEYKSNIRLYAYIDSIGVAYSAADVVVSRSGALSIAELAAAGKPTIFIPSPNVTDDQQNKNVSPIVNSGAAIKVEDSAAASVLAQQIIYLIKDPQRQRIMSDKIRSWGNKSNAAECIFNEIKKYI